MRRLEVLFLLAAGSFLLSGPLFAQMQWYRATDSAAWSARTNHALVAFDDKLWVIGGYSPSLFHQDVWYSTDGANWTLATDSAGWSPRLGHTAVAFDNKLWVLGGESNVRPYDRNDVWYSADGVNWTEATDSASWSGRKNHSSVVFDNKLWVLGGKSSTGQPLYKRDVWYSTDGVSWNRAADSTGWLGRHSHTSVVFDNKLWVVGGYSTDSGGSYKNDVWYSTDGANWNRATDSAGWSARCEHTSAVLDGRIWVMGGQIPAGPSYKNDVWCSTDGADWVQANVSAAWSARAYHASGVFNDEIWLTGGYQDPFPYYCQDVWHSNGLGIQEGRRAGAGRSKPEVYPNPARTVIRVRRPFADNRATAVRILDRSGKLARAVAPRRAEPGSPSDRDGELTVRLDGIRPGVYFLQLGAEVRKFLVVE